MQSYLEAELARLRERILKMGALVEQQISHSITALIDQDTTLARQTIENDHHVNAIDVEIDEECVRLLALYHPVGRDLRFITTAMKITTDLERMSDLSEDICERVIELAEESLSTPDEEIRRIADAAQQMVRKTLHAFVNYDATLARSVCADDELIDHLTHQIFMDLLALMIRESQIVTRAIRMSFVAKYLERIGDHATNIAEMVVYMVEGKIIRHTQITPSAPMHPKDRAQSH